MCSVCGHLWCVRGCPDYVPEEDPGVTGRCECCGRVVFGFGTTRCEACREEDERNGGDEDKEAEANSRR